MSIRYVFDLLVDITMKKTVAGKTVADVSRSASLAVPGVDRKFGRVFHGAVARNASLLQQQTRTLLTEVDVDNADGALTAGLYGVAHLQEPRARSVVLVPSQSVIFDKNGLSVAVFVVAYDERNSG